MKTIRIDIIKEDVFEEVSKTSAYSSVKKTDEQSSAYDRIAIVDDDKNMIEKYWRESADVITETLKQFIVPVSDIGMKTIADMDINYTIDLKVSDRFDDNLNSAIASSIFGFFVNNILARWSEMTDKDNVQAYQNNAVRSLSQLKEKVYYKVEPKRQEITL